MAGYSIGQLFFEFAIIDRTRAATQLKEVERQIQAVEAGFVKAGLQLDRFGIKMQMVAKDMILQWSLASAIIVGVTEMIAVKFDAAMRDVQRTSGLSRAEIDLLGKSFLEMSVNMPGKHAAQTLADIAVVAGQLGLKGRQQIEQFTVAIYKLSTMYENLAPKETAEQMAQIANAFNMPIDAVGRMGSVISRLANIGVATAAQLLEFTQAVAGSAQNLGIPFDQIVALGNALIQIGVPARQAGTALTNFFVKAAIVPGKFAETMKIPTEQFKKMLQENPVETIIGWFDALKDKGIFGVAEAITMLGIRGAKADNILMKLAQNGVSFFRDSMAASSDEMRTGTATEKQWIVENSKMEAQLNRTMNQVEKTAIGIGTNFFPVLKVVSNALAAFSNILDDLPPVLKNFGMSMMAVIAVAGPLMLVFGNSTRMISGFVIALAKAATGAMTFKAAFATLSPGGWIFLGIAALATIFTLLSNNEGEAEGKALQLSNTLRDKLNKRLDELKKSGGGANEQVAALTRNLQILDEAEKALLRGKLRGDLKTAYGDLIAAGTPKSETERKFPSDATKLAREAETQWKVAKWNGVQMDFGPILAAVTAQYTRSLDEARRGISGAQTSADQLAALIGVLTKLQAARDALNQAEIATPTPGEPTKGGKATPEEQEKSLKLLEAAYKEADSAIDLYNQKVKSRKEEESADKRTKLNEKLGSSYLALRNALVSMRKDAIEPIDKLNFGTKINELDSAYLRLLDRGSEKGKVRQADLDAEVQILGIMMSQYEQDQRIAEKEGQLPEFQQAHKKELETILALQKKITDEIDAQLGGFLGQSTFDPTKDLDKLIKKMETMSDDEKAIILYLLGRRQSMGGFGKRFERDEKNSPFEDFDKQVKLMGFTARNGFDAMASSWHSTVNKMSSEWSQGVFKIRTIWETALQSMAQSAITMLLDEIFKKTIANAVGWLVGLIFPGTSGVQNKVTSGGGYSTITAQDFLVRSDGTMMNFSPDDTVVGFKSVAGLLNSIMPNVVNPNFSTMPQTTVNVPRPSVSVKNQTPKVEVYIRGTMNGQKFLRDELPKQNRWQTSRKLTK